MTGQDVVTIEHLAERSVSMQRDRSWLGPVVGLAILVVLVWRVGAGAFVGALQQVDPWAVGAAAAIAVVTTVCGAWRWVLVARALGAELSLRSAVAECYRSQLLNVTLPGGVLGDLHRGVRHGRDGGDLGRGLRSVVWERSAGQVVLLTMTIAAVLAVPSPLTSWLTRLESTVPTVLLGSVALVALGTVALLVIRAGASAAREVRWREVLPLPVLRMVQVLVADVRAGLRGRHTGSSVLALSALVVVGHVTTFVLAARSAGVSAPATTLVPLALVVLVAMGLPLNLAGWGPREGVAAWAFGAVGLGAAAGVGTAVVYGVMALVSALPGAAVLAATRRRSPPTRGVLAGEEARDG